MMHSEQRIANRVSNLVAIYGPNLAAAAIGSDPLFFRGQSDGFSTDVHLALWGSVGQAERWRQVSVFRLLMSVFQPMSAP